MPHFDGARGRIHYRSWTVPDPRASIVFLHGFGEHSGLYARLAGALNASAIDLWALDQVGHGLSEGPRGDIGSVDALEANARTLTEIVARETPGVPTVLAGHSAGGITAALAISRDPSPWRAAILSGTPITPPEWVSEALASGGEGLALDPADLSSDGWYLDALANDPLSFTESEGSPLDSLPAAWDELSSRFAEVDLPVLFVHGTADRVAPVDGAREWAARLADAEIREFDGARHDVLNEQVHEQVAAAVAGWVLARVAPEIPAAGRA